MRVVLVDDHSILRQSLRILLDSRPDMEVVAEFANAREAVAAAAELRPDVVLMDVFMPELNGIEATRQIRRAVPGTRVLILSAYGDAEQLRLALRAGAAGYVIKRSDVDELVMAIHLVRHGNTYFSEDLAKQFDLADLIYEAKRPGGASALDRLTARETEVLQLIAEGCTIKMIAERLVVSPKTVDGHKTRIMSKLGARNRSDLIRFALKAELIQLDDVAHTA